MNYRKCRLINAIISIVLFLVLFADMFYVFGKLGTDVKENFSGEIIFTVYYLAVAIACLIFFHKDENYSASYYVWMTVLIFLLPIVIWIYVVISYAVDGGEFMNWQSGWILVLTTVSALVMAAINIFCAVKTRK